LEEEHDPMQRKKLNVEGVMIDYGDTLAYTDEKANKVHEEKMVSILKKHGYASGWEKLKPIFAELNRTSSRGEITDLHEFYSILLGKLNLPEETILKDQLIEARKRFYVPSIKLYEGVIPMLARLRKKYRLALVSNCAAGTREIIDSLGLTKFFEAVVLSYEVGVRKPDRRIYLEALRRMGLAPEKCIFVADEISDLEGARSVAMITMLVHQGSNTFCEAENPYFKPDLEFDNISQITEYL
jgi:putative hydrolase of the HAD superfamily